jgi:alpha-beta hydrolase superfamily lysophospholipase
VTCSAETLGVTHRGNREVTSLRLTAADGGRFAVHRVAVNAPIERAPVVLVPGMFTGRAFWLSDGGVGLAAFLADRGFEPWIVERRGIGASGVATARAGLKQHVEHDLPAVQQQVQARCGRPAFWIGHSLGGMLVASAAARSLDPTQIAGLVLFATQLEDGKTVLDWPWNLVPRATAHLMGRLPARLAGLGPEDEPAAAVADAARWTATARRRPEFLDALRGVQVPVLALVGAADRVDPPQGCRKLFDRLGSSDKRFEIVGRHTGYSDDPDHPGIVVSRSARTEVWPRVAAWLDEHEYQPEEVIA